MSNHLNYFRFIVEQPIEKLRKDLEDRETFKNGGKGGKKPSIVYKKDAGLEGTVSNITKEVIAHPVSGVNLEISRIFVTSKESSSDYDQIGWIHQKAVLNCMICNAEFGVDNKKHNCATCGNVVCHTCSDNKAFIDELSLDKKTRVCNQCFKGEVGIHANSGPNFFYDENIIFVTDDAVSIGLN